MRHRSKLMLAALAAALALGAIVTAATATRLAISNQLFRATWTEGVPLVIEGGAGLGTIRCPVTMEGTFHSRTVVKNTAALIGFITSATVFESSCTGGLLNPLQASLPWHVFYDGFSGTLPRITAIDVRVVGAAAIVHNNFGVSCLFTSTAASPLKASLNRNTTTGVLESLTPNEAAEIPVTSGNLGFNGCPASVMLRGRSATLGIQRNTATRITVTLVA
jgi:hypothetical protein